MKLIYSEYLKLYLKNKNCFSRSMSYIKSKD